MKKVEQSEARHLHNTHVVFYLEHIISMSAKAFRVRLLIPHQGLAVFWVPLSKLKYSDDLDNRPHVYSPAYGGNIPNSGYGQMRRRYYCPKYFTSPHNHKKP